jgi:hypothetical protein
MRSPDGRRVTITVVAPAVVVLAGFLALPGWASAASRATGRVELSRLHATPAGGLAGFSGRAPTHGGARVAVQARSGARWRTLVAGRTDHRGRFDLTWIVPGQAARLRVRAVVEQGSRASDSSRAQRLVVKKSPGRVVTVTPGTQVISAATVTAAPPPGQAGTVRFSGGNAVQVGNIIDVAPGPQTPDGMLAKVTSVIIDGATTDASTVPATLMQAIPAGSFDQTLSQAPGSAGADVDRVVRPEAKTVICKGSGSASIQADASVGVSFEVKGSWSLFHGAESASLSGNANAQASVTATVQGAGTCTLNPITLADLKGPSDTFFIGPLPFYLSSAINIDVDAQATAKAKVTTGISGGYSATAGVGCTRTGGFYPIEAFGPKFTDTPPTLTDSANITADVAPTLQVSLDGAGHADLNLKAGLDLAASTTANPWWNLTAPVSLTGDLNISKLGLQSPTLNIWSHSYELANAGGPLNGGSGAGSDGAAVSVTNPGDQSGSTDISTNLQIQATASDGGQLSYDATGLPAGLSIDPTSGLITGTPTTAGVSNVTVTAADASGSIATTTFTWTIEPYLDPFQ